MDQPPLPSTRASSSDENARRPESAAQRLQALSSLLQDLEEAPESARVLTEAAHQNKLVQVRLGVATSLFTALRGKHAPSAAHSLRVALGCSSWTLAVEMTAELRDEIEVAALLHDIGKIGVPDHLLLKPSRLSPDEQALLEEHRQQGLEILSGCSASKSVLANVHYCSAWFDGRKAGFDRKGEDLPLGARMIAIVDAFDAMTTDHVYRRAMSRERAMAELFECGGTQFDPRLVRDFCALLASDKVKFNAAVARRWLQELHPEAANALWSLSRPSLAAKGEAPRREQIFHQNLLETMHDAVVFVDSGLRILEWNLAAERLTGLPAASVIERKWLPSLVELCDERGEAIHEADCPVAQAMAGSAKSLRRLALKGREGKSVAVDVHVSPVVGRNGAPIGSTLILHDASSRITLEERVQSLHQKATRDPLTQVSNRAEFDRVHRQFVETHLGRGLPCSLIICDLDHFKRINDNFGHQAGDDALVSFSGLLRRFHRTGDLVARYGGEEFVMLCADCDNATAMARAEEIRRELAEMQQPALGGKCITASFGVTEIQGGDTPETMLRRADRALLQAKDLGRNTVVQLGSGLKGEEKPAAKASWFSWFSRAAPDQLLERTLVTPVPIKVAAEKLRGFVSDQHAEIISIDENNVAIRIDGLGSPLLRRNTDRAVPFCVELRFEETRVDAHGREEGGTLRTLIHVALRPVRNRDRRRRDVLERARQLLGSLKSYLMAHDYMAPPGNEPIKQDGVLEKAKTIFAPLFGKQR
jgi:diguanylate cyclase (GGDEF)-like protein/PAS domain S-box-containing protein